MAGKVFKRELILTTNSDIETYIIPVKVHTASLPVVSKPPYLLILSLLILIILGILVGEFFWPHISYDLRYPGSPDISSIMLLMSIMLFGLIICCIAILDAYEKRKFSHSFAMSSLFFTIALGISITLIISLEYINDLISSRAIILNLTIPYDRSSELYMLLNLLLGEGNNIDDFREGYYVLNLLGKLTLLGSGLSLAIMMFYPVFQQQKIIADYRKKEKDQRLIRC